MPRSQRLITPTQYGQLLNLAGYSINDFSRLTDCDRKRAKRWLSDAQEGYHIPPWVPLVLLGLTVPEAREKMEAFAAMAREAQSGGDNAGH